MTDHPSPAPVPGQPDPEDQAILEARALALASQGDQGPEPGPSLELLLFQLADETYGIAMDAVREVHHLRAYTPLPGTPQFLLGIMNLRGEIVSVVDLKKFFGLPERGLGELNKVIVIQGPGMEFGILADVILGLHAVALKEISPTPPTVDWAGAAYLRGVAPGGVIILDAQRLLEDDKLVVRQEMA